MDALQYPADKRAHRFFPLDRSDFHSPAGRTDRYTIIEFSMFEGRSVDAKKRLIRLLFERVRSECGIESPSAYRYQEKFNNRSREHREKMDQQNHAPNNEGCIAAERSGASNRARGCEGPIGLERACPWRLPTGWEGRR